MLFRKKIFIYDFFLERGEGRREREREGGRETSMQERNIDWFPLVIALTGDWA